MRPAAAEHEHEHLNRARWRCSRRATKGAACSSQTNSDSWKKERQRLRSMLISLLLHSDGLRTDAGSARARDFIIPTPRTPGHDLPQSGPTGARREMARVRQINILQRCLSLVFVSGLDFNVHFPAWFLPPLPLPLSFLLHSAPSVSKSPRCKLTSVPRRQEVPVTGYIGQGKHSDNCV